MKSTFLIAALFAGVASAQSPLTLPNNSAGTALDTPPVLPAGPDVLVPATPKSDTAASGVKHEEVEQLAGPKAADDADKNGDGRIDDKELRRLQDAPAPLK
jgi:hypothetical protein